MIRSVTFEETIYNDLPYKFEAGTPNIAGAIGLGAAVDYYRSFDQKALHEHESRVLRYATDALASVPGLRLIGTAPGKVAALSFLMNAAHPHDIGTIVDSEGVAIRTGHHCAQPVMEHFGIAATARASLGIYNTTDDIDALVRALEKVQELFG
jgi:cysteine desulfurase/selenocysteine lyase